MVGKCSKCGLCCLWTCLDLARVDFDVSWVNVRGGKIVDGFTFIPTRCPQLTVNNLCSIHDHKPRWCKIFPVADEPWLRAMGCKYWEEE